jgi:hypothetical protein
VIDNEAVVAADDFASESIKIVSQITSTKSGAGMKVNQIARQLGLCRRRIDKWIQFTNYRKGVGCSRARECPNRSETIYVSGRRAVF